MGGVQKRHSRSSKNKTHHRAFNKTKNYIKDHDQIHEDLLHPEKFEKLEVDEERPGSGQHYCVACARYF